MNSNYQYPFWYADENTKRLVWNKGSAIPGFSPDLWRRDVCGHAMSYQEHGNTNSQFGWEIDHIYPREKGGPTTLDNLQPLYWRTNRVKSDEVEWACPVGI